MDTNQIVDLWTFFKEYIDKKQIEIAAEKYVDLLADLGVDEPELLGSVGSEEHLDEAIRYYLDLDGEEDEDI